MAFFFGSFFFLSAPLLMAILLWEFTFADADWIVTRSAINISLYQDCIFKLSVLFASINIMGNESNHIFRLKFS